MAAASDPGERLRVTPALADPDAILSIAMVGVVRVEGTGGGTTVQDRPTLPEAGAVGRGGERRAGDGGLRAGVPPEGWRERVYRGWLANRTAPVQDTRGGPRVRRMPDGKTWFGRWAGDVTLPFFSDLVSRGSDEGERGREVAVEEFRRPTVAVTYARVARVIETDLGNELVLLDPETQQMYSLNETGRCIWRALPASGEGPLIDALVAAYDVSREAAEADMRRILAELLDAGLIEVRGDAAGG